MGGKRAWIVAIGLAIAAAGCGGSVEARDGDGGRFTNGDGGAFVKGDAEALPIGEAGTPAAACPAGGPPGATPALLGPPPGGLGDLWRGLGQGDGEGEAFTLPRAGVIDRVVVQIFANPGVQGCRTRIYRHCGGERILVSTTDTAASAFPVYASNMYDQDLRTTSIAIDPPVPVAAGEEVEAIFSAIGGSTYSSMLVSVITTGDIYPDAFAVYPDEPDWAITNDDYHAQIELR